MGGPDLKVSQMRPSLSTYSGQSSAVGMVNGEIEALAAFRRVSKYHLGQIITLALAFIFSTAVCLTLSYVNYILSPECILYSQWTGKVETVSSANRRSSRQVNADLIPDGNITGSDFSERQISLESQTQSQLPTTDFIKLDTGLNWSKKKPCYLTQYGYASAAVCAFILCWFFVFFRPTKEAYLFKKRTAASKFIIPSILFCFAFTVCVFVAVVTLERGMASWCNSVPNIKTSSGHLQSCSSVQDYALEFEGKFTSTNYYSFLLAGQIFAWLGAFAWLTSLIILILRCYWHIDFPDYFFEHSVINNDGFDTDQD